MALRIPWDKYETALLIEACCLVNNGVIRRKDAISQLSKQLRQMAIDNGIIIDDVYRNENGISMQFEKVKSLIRHQPNAEKHNTKIFIEMVEMYYNDRTQFEQILNTAKGEVPQLKNNQDQFLKWLAERVSASKLSDYYLLIPEIDSFARINRIYAGSLFDVYDTATALNLVGCLGRKRQNKKMTDLAVFYHKYLVENPSLSSQHKQTESISSSPQKEPQPSKPVNKHENADLFRIPESNLLQGQATDTDRVFSVNSSGELYVCDPGITSDKIITLAESRDTGASETIGDKEKTAESTESEEKTVDFYHKASYAFTKPVSASYFGDQFYESSWRTLYKKLCKLLSLDYPDVFKTLRDQSTSGNREYMVYDSEIAKSLTKPYEVANGIFVETNRSATDLMESIRKLLDACLVDYENVEIRYVRKPQTSKNEEIFVPVIAQNGKAGQIPSDSDHSKTKAGQMRQAFMEWLKSQKYSLRSVESAADAVQKASDFALRHRVTETPFFEITDYNLFLEISKLLKAMDEFKQFNKEYYGLFLINVKAYLRFLKIYKKNDETDEPQVVSEIESSSSRGITSPSFESEQMRQAFIAWMQKNGYSQSSCNGYASALLTIGEFAKEKGVATRSFFEMTDPNESTEVWRKLRLLPEYISYNRDQHNRFSAAIKQFIVFHSTYNKAAPISSKAQTTSDTGNPTPAQKKSAGSQKRTPAHPGMVEFEKWLNESNCPGGSIKTYLHRVEKIGKYLLDNGLEERNIFSIRGIARLERIRESLQKDENFQSSEGVGMASLALFALKKYISFRKNDTSDDVDGEIADRFSAILKDEFDNGYRVASLIDRNRFKQFYSDRYGEEIQLNDEELVLTLAKIGTVQEERIFMREGAGSDDLLDDIQADIARTFKEGASCIYYSELFNKYQTVLADRLQVFDADVMKKLLVETSYREYFPGKDFFFLYGRSYDVSNDVKKFMLHASEPMTYDEIHERLWYIPRDVIKQTLRASSDMINVAQETYMHINHFPISADELKRISELINGQLSQRSFITDAELRELIEKNCPSVAINTESYSARGLRGALSVLLKDQFSFNGTVISRRGVALRKGQVYEEFCSSHELMTFDDLQAFAKEMSKGLIPWDTVMDVMVRISQSEFMPKGSVNFDIAATDRVLDELMEGQYMPLGSFRLFLHYPPVNVKWNKYLLESYVAGYSAKFRLVHSSWLAYDCCGAIVRRDSKLKDFEDVVTDALAHSDEWKTANDALAFLSTQGYLLDKRWTKINTILPEAKRRRERLKDSAGN